MNSALVIDIVLGVNLPNIQKYYQEADIYLSTSLYEGLSNSILEAMSFSLPVVATDVGDNKYLVKENETGFLLPVKDVYGICDKLQFLVENPDIRQEMGKKAYKHINNNFSIEKLTHEYVSFIERLTL